MFDPNAMGMNTISDDELGDLEDEPLPQDSNLLDPDDGESEDDRLEADEDDPAASAQSWFSNTRFAPGLRKMLTKKQARRKIKGKML